MSTEKHAHAGEPTATAFLDALQEKHLLPGKTLATLRKQVFESKTPIPARQVAKLLIDKGLLAMSVAHQMLGDETKPPAKPAPSESSGQAQAVAKPAAAQHAATKLSSPAAALGKGQPPKPAAPTAPAKAAPPVGGGLASLLDEEFNGLPSLGAGPLDALMSDPSLAAAVQGVSPLDLPTPHKKGVSSWAKWISRWARKRLWTWIGIASAAGMVIAAISVWAANRQDPRQVLQSADALYQGGDYGEAIKQYDDFLTRYPNYAAAGRVRVRRGLARLRVHLAEARSEAAALAAAKAVLPTISTEAEYDDEAGPVLATLLPPLAEASASHVGRHAEPASIAQSEEILALAQQYLPAADKPRERLGSVEAILALARQRADADRELAKATAAIRQAVTEKDFKEAYRIRTALLNAYPQFSTYDDLTEAVARISAAEQAAVTRVAKQQSAEKETAAATVPTVILAPRTFTASAAGAEGHVIFAVAAGAVYGLEATSGKVLWRTFVGFNPDGRDEGCEPIAFTPQAVGCVERTAEDMVGYARSRNLENAFPCSVAVRVTHHSAGVSVLHPPYVETAFTPQADSDVVMAAAAHREVQRVEAATGRVKWRYAVAEGLCGDPVVAGDQVLAATRSGRLVMIDAATGNSEGFVQLPQAVGIAPAVDLSRKLVFQVADSDNLFVLTMPEGRCCQVLPLGHGPGSIVAPPAVFGDYLLIAVNDTAGDSSLRVLEIRAAEPQSSDPPLRLVQTISLKGHVDVGPSIAGDRLLLATDNGAVHLLERSGADAKLPLREVAGMQLEGGPGLVRFPLLQTGTCVVGDVQLASFKIDPAKNHLSPAWRDSFKGAVCQPPVAIGQTVFTVRHREDLPGMVVSAVSVGKGTPFWQTCLATPLACEPVVSPDGRKATAVTALGDTFMLPSPASAGLTILDQPAAAPPPGFAGPVTGVVRCGEKLALVVPPLGGIPPKGGTTSASSETHVPGTARANHVLVFDPADPQKPLASCVPPASLACSPIAFAGGLLAPLSAGQIYLLDPLSGESLCVPFQPRLRPGALPAWRGPVAVGDKEVAIFDGRNKLYRLQLVEKPSLRLDVAAEVELNEPIVSPLVTTGKAVCGVDAAGKLDFFQLPGLARSQQHALAGPSAWGPYSIGNRVLLASEAGPCYCFDESGQPLWQTALPYGRLVGTPLAVKDHYLLAAASGVVWRADASSGKVLGKVDVGRPLATGPVPVGDRLLIGGHDGSLYQIAVP